MLLCFYVKMLNEIRQPLSDVVDLYCRNISESQLSDTVDFLPTVVATVVNDVMCTVRQVRPCLLGGSPVWAPGL